MAEATRRSRPEIRLLDNENAERIVQAAFRILEQTGAKVESSEALAVLKGRGAIINGDVARIPGDVVKACLETMPKRMNIFGRDGASPLKLGAGNTYYAPGMTCPSVLDPFTSEHRPFLRKDAALVGLLCDALPNVDYVIGGGIIDDVTPILAAAYEFSELSANTRKPIFGWAHNETVMEDIFQMASAIAGGDAEFQEKPNCLLFINPISPLVHSPDVSARILTAAKYRIPLIVWSGPLAGGTGPITMAGGLAVTVAELLSALVINQSARPGAPFIFGATIAPLDMRRSNIVWSPSRALANLAMIGVMKHLGAISYVSAAGSNSKILDQQATLETAYPLVTTTLAGPDLIAGLGSLEAGMTFSPALLTIANDVVEIARRMRRGFSVDDDTLALDVIDSVGPGGHFLMTDHTLTHFKEEHWEPSLLDLEVIDNWDGRTLGDRVKAKIEEIASSHKPVPMPDRARAAIDEILKRAEQRERTARQ